MEMLEDYIISMKSNAKDVCHTLWDVGDFCENDLCCKFKNDFHDKNVKKLKCSELDET
jgi:hypothetical protein